ncbi:uncharacterized protein Dmul_10700 [Desulfococcus multivorans]|nr:uncharacterized protein Dmul_10700 [Desulfococcus multivorans]
MMLEVIGMNHRFVMIYSSRFSLPSQKPKIAWFRYQQPIQTFNRRRSEVGRIIPTGVEFQ